MLYLRNQGIIEKIEEIASIKQADAFSQKQRKQRNKTFI